MCHGEGGLRLLRGCRLRCQRLLRDHGGPSWVADPPRVWRRRLWLSWHPDRLLGHVWYLWLLVLWGECTRRHLWYRAPWQVDLSTRDHMRL